MSTPSDKPSPAEPVFSALTVDVEDWVQSVYDPDAPLTECFVRNTRRVLEHLAARDVTATFFVLGLAAEKAPYLVREIQSAGHEVQSHGYGHRLIQTQTPQQFREDVLRSKSVLEELLGKAVVGYRAPAFSITADTIWALDVLCECGFEYDSSIFPVKTRRYGIAGTPPHAHQRLTAAGSILEFPVASFAGLGRRWPVGGGGYFRLLPYLILRRAIAQNNAAGHGAVVYMHPYEYSPDEFSQLPYSIPTTLRLHQSLGRRTFKRKIDRMLGEFPFATLQAVRDHLRGAELASDTARTALHREVNRPVALLGTP